MYASLLTTAHAQQQHQQAEQVHLLAAVVEAIGPEYFLALVEQANDAVAPPDTAHP